METVKDIKDFKRFIELNRINYMQELRMRMT